MTKEGRDSAGRNFSVVDRTLASVGVIPCGARVANRMISVNLLKINKEGHSMPRNETVATQSFFPARSIECSGKPRRRGGVFLPFVAAALTITACSPEAQSNAGAEKRVEQVQPKGGTIEQRAIAEEMRGLVLARGIVQRLTEMCADFQIDDSKMNAERQRLMDAAQKQFSSQKEFLDAAGAGNPAKTGEDMRRFFLDRGVKWESPPKDYCALAEALQRDQSSAGKYLIKRK